MRESFFGAQTLPCVLEPDGRVDASPGALAAWLASERGFLRDRTQRFGAVLLRGFGLSGAEDFLRMAQAVAEAPLMPYIGGDAPRGRVHDKIYNSTDAPPALEIFPHNEKSYSAAYPRRIMFFCDRARMSGGETPLVDGRRVLARLDPVLADAFRRRRVTYIQNLYDDTAFHETPPPGKSWQVAFEDGDRARVEESLRRIGAEFRWRADGSLYVEETVDGVIRHPETKEEVFFSQADQWHVSYLDAATRAALLAHHKEDELYHAARFGDGAKMTGEMLDEVRAAIRAETVRFPWQVGDLLVVDNILALHGRAPFEGDRRILVAMA